MDFKLLTLIGYICLLLGGLFLGIAGVGIFFWILMWAILGGILNIAIIGVFLFVVGYIIKRISERR